MSLYATTYQNISIHITQRLTSKPLPTNGGDFDQIWTYAFIETSLGC